jgi:hypothetical protein
VTEWPKSRQIAAQYQSAGITGIGFARYASSGAVTPELWENIRTAESLAESNVGKPMVEHWAEDMAALRTALREEGIYAPIEVREVTDTSVTIAIDGLEVAIWRSALDFDEGQPVIQIDGAGMLRVNVNDYPVWNADPDNHEHEQCACVTDFEAREAP